MLIVVSPAKKLDYETPSKTEVFTQPEYLEHSKQLIRILVNYSTLDISELMHVSSNISELNFERYQSWNMDFNINNSKQALLAFKGDVYTGLDGETFSKSDFNFAQKHLRILSGLYGILKPLDLMKAYRLEMSTRLQSDRGKNLYEFWGEIITDGLNSQLKKIKSSTLINLASNEYFKSVKTKCLNADIITPAFKEYKNGDYKMIGIYAKRARGLMSRYIIKNRIKDIEDIKDFGVEGYRYSKQLSKGNNWVFTRRKML